MNRKTEKGFPDVRGLCSKCNPDLNKRHSKDFHDVTMSDWSFDHDAGIIFPKKVVIQCTKCDCREVKKYAKARIHGQDFIS